MDGLLDGCKRVESTADLKVDLKVVGVVACR